MDKPKILLVDIPPVAAKLLKDNGFNVLEGTFGSPYRVQPMAGNMPVFLEGANLPNHAEAKIVVVDLAKSPSNDRPPLPDLSAWKGCLVSGNTKVVDPRPVTMWWAQGDFDRTLQLGGVFVIFGAARDEYDYFWATVERREVVQQSQASYSNWDLLRDTTSERLGISPARGHEMRVVSDSIAICRLIAKHLAGGQFLCVFSLTSQLYPWQPLVLNGFDDWIGVASVGDPGKGMILILPQLNDKPGFLLSLMKDVLPEMTPALFPELEGAKWVHRPEYELPAVSLLNEEIELVKTQAEQKIVSLGKQIDETRQRESWLHDLLRQTGAPLVSAVKRALAELGFRQIIDMDETAKAEESAAGLREDLQAHDRNPPLVIDVKGLGGHANDDAAFQAKKHASYRTEEAAEAGVAKVFKGLSIINHHRHLPPSDRGEEGAFQPLQVDVARSDKLGLMTTWELYRIVRNARKLGWAFEQVAPIFYRSGRVGVLPGHYAYVGHVGHIWEKTSVIRLVVEEHPLRAGDRVAFDLGIEFEEQDVTSLQVEKENVIEVSAGAHAGMKTHLKRPDLKIGLKVYKIAKA